MANPLTGDFEAVLQVGVGTIHRLVACMHRNAGDPSRPHLPRWAWIRVGDDGALDGVRGSVQAQLGVPRVELIHGATDRFWLSVDVRARYRPDPGTTRLADVIHGVVRAMYHFADIDPNCHGYGGGLAELYLWLRPVEGSVSFEGTVYDLPRPGGPGIGDDLDETAVKAEIERQVEHLLDTRFAATAHPVGPRFRRGRMRSLSAGGESAVAAAIDVTASPPAADIASVENIVLAGDDLAVAISAQVIMRMVEPILTTLRGMEATVSLTVVTPWPAPNISTVYHAGVTSATAAWEGHGSFGVIKIHVEGRARTESVLADADVRIDQDIVVNFDPAGPSLWLSAGSRTITVDSSGLGAGTVASAVAQGVGQALDAQLAAYLAAATPALQSILVRRDELVQQLQTIDENADAVFLSGDFGPDGVVLRGRIVLTPGFTRLWTRFERTADRQGYTAFATVVPGGIVDRYEWTWTFTDPGGGAVPPPGGQAETHDFMLRRPRAGGAGAAVGALGPLPGVTDAGKVCLVAYGRRVDDLTGELGPVGIMASCVVWEDDPQINIITLPPGRLLLTVDLAAGREEDRDAGVVAVGATSSPGEAANTLVLYTDGAPSAETRGALEAAVRAAAGRPDAGVGVLVVQAPGEDAGAEWAALARGLDAPVRVVADEDGRWATALVVPPGEQRDGPAWRLLSPAGGITWLHDGPPDREAVASELPEVLLPSPPPGPRRLDPRVRPGERIDVFLSAPHCPPMPRRGAGERYSTLVLTQAAGGVRRGQASRLRREAESLPGWGTTAVILDGAGADAAAALREELGDGWDVVADPDGAISDALGVRFWPTTIELDADGLVAAVRTGSAP